ncbi:MAG: GMP synthase (glutamine-hydrolyzing), partial [Clostridiales bacterium]|nr:GMP synthase (glutamine-hydrolyzing) [Clostridiales bacterium]
MARNMIAVVDLGGRENSFIARKIRKGGVYSEIVPYDVTLEQLRAMNAKGLVLSIG